MTRHRWCSKGGDEREGKERRRGGTGARALECFERPRAALSGARAARWLRGCRGRGPFRGKPALPRAKEKKQKRKSRPSRTGLLRLITTLSSDRC